MFRRENYNTIIIGAGPSGLATGYHLQQKGIDYLLLEGTNRVANSWHYVWEDFRLAQKISEVTMAGLNLANFNSDYRLTRDEIILAFENYAKDHQLKIQFNTQVNAINKDNFGNYTIHTSNGEFAADNIVLGIGARQQPRFPVSITTEIQQRYQGQMLHSAWYKNSGSFHTQKNILVIGSGLSALSITKNLVDQPHVHYKVAIACAYTDHEIAVNNKHLPTIPVKLTELEAEGVENFGRFIGLGNEDNLEFQIKGKTNISDFTTIIFATGYLYAYDLLFKLMADFAEKLLEHDNGITDEPGLYVVGLPLKGEKTVTISQGNTEAENVAAHISQRNYGKIYSKAQTFFQSVAEQKYHHHTPTVSPSVSTVRLANS